MEGKQKTAFNRRSFNVLVMLFAFVLLPPTGIMIHETGGLSERDTLRHFAMSVHNLSAVIFLITCFIHLGGNGKAIWRYITNIASSNRRSLNVLVMSFALLLLPPSGMLLHQAHGLSERSTLQHLVMVVHNISAVVFLITCIIHLAANRKVIWRYVANKSSEYFGYRKEVFVALAIVFGIVGLFAMHAFHVR